CGLAVAALPLRASTVAPMTLAEVALDAELIFEGRVLSSEVRQLPGGAIHTFVLFELVDVLKGSPQRSQVELAFLGGSLDGRRLQVTDMVIPALGETGFYFVESTTTPLVNPLLGWSQGHYLIHRTADGGSVVTTAAGEPIIALEADNPRARALSLPLDVERFRDSVLDILAEGAR